MTAVQDFFREREGTGRFGNRGEEEKKDERKKERKKCDREKERINQNKDGRNLRRVRRENGGKGKDSEYKI